MAGRKLLAGRYQRIGLLGGSFNPAHAGHRAISIGTMKALGLDAVWWLVSPQNPLKSSSDTKPLAERVAYAEAIAQHPRICVTDIEASLSSCYTVDTVKYLKKRFPSVRFIWIMGADNLVQFPLWNRWQEIARLIPIVIYDRNHHIYKGLTGKMAVRYKRYRLTGRELPMLGTSVPGWAVLRLRKHALSSTALRAEFTGS